MSEEDTTQKKKISNAELDNVKNYLVIEFAYDMHICLPYKEGIALLGSLEHAEKVKVNGYSTKTVEFESTLPTFQTTMISQQTYREQKMKHLLGVSDD